MKTYLCVLAAGFLAGIGTQASGQQPDNSQVYEAFPERVPFDRATRQVEPPVPTSLNMPDAFRVGVNIHELKPLSEADIAVADARAALKYAEVRPGPDRVGIVRATGSTPVSVQKSLVWVREFDLEQKLWTLAIGSPGAYGIRLHFTAFDVGADSAIVYARNDGVLVVRGPYTGTGPDGDGDFWTASLPGDEVFIEVTSPDEPQFQITEIIHFDHDVFGVSDASRDGPPLLDCHLDVNCFGSVDWVARTATGKMNFSDSEGSYGCTGTLLTDLDDETLQPYFLTAKHCLDTQAMVDTLEVTWFYETDTCDGTVPDPLTLPRNVGGTLMATYGENDMTFILLNGDLPEGIGMAGWTSSTSSASYGVHHPKGSWKRVVFLEEPFVGCGTKDPTDYDSYDQTNGLTQSGSSGSGAFNNSGQLAGQLWGICSATTDPDDLSCSNIDNFWAVYGEFEETWSEIGWYLIIGGTLHVDPAGDCLVPYGTVSCPLLSIQDAIDAAWPGVRVKIQAGSYTGPTLFDKPVTLMAMNGDVTIGG